MSAREQTGRWCVVLCWPSPCCSRHRPPPTPRARAWPRCRSRCARTPSTQAPSTASPGPPRRRRSAAFRRPRDSTPTASSAATTGALGTLGRHPIGSRLLRLGHLGSDVAALQFALETHGFPFGSVDGGFGPHTEAAVMRLQTFAGLPSDGVAGPCDPPRPLPPAGRSARAALADQRRHRRPLRTPRQQLPRGHRLPGRVRHDDPRRRFRPRRLRRVRRRLGPDHRPRPRQLHAPATHTSRARWSTLGATVSAGAAIGRVGALATPPARTCTSRSPSAEPTRPRASPEPKACPFIFGRRDQARRGAGVRDALEARLEDREIEQDRALVAAARSRRSARCSPPRRAGRARARARSGARARRRAERSRAPAGGAIAHTPTRSPRSANGLAARSRRRAGASGR